MKKYRIIFHIDLNAFYASCEEAKDPSLKNKPIGIGKNTERGILTTANYAARKYGVTSAMSVYEAKKRCPQLLVVSPTFGLYEEYSELFFNYLKTKSDLLEPASIDEGYLDVTDVLEGKHPLELAQEIQETLMKQHNLPVSIGIAPNKFLAKMASDMKKPLGITVLRKRDVQEKLWPLPIDKMYGIGKKTVPNLKLLGIQTIGDLANFKDTKKLSRFLGNQTESFIGKAHGEANNVVDPTKSETVQSIGNSKTYEGYLHDYETMLKALSSLTESVVKRLQKRHLSTKTITVQVRFNDFTQHSKNFSAEQHVNTFEEIFPIVDHLFDTLSEDKPVHLLGVSAGNLEKETMLFRQINIFEGPVGKKEDDHINKLLKSINDNYKSPLLKKGVK